MSFAFSLALALTLSQDSVPLSSGTPRLAQAVAMRAANADAPQPSREVADALGKALDQNNWQTRMEQLLKVLELAQSKKDVPGEVVVWVWLGTGFHALGIYKESADCHKFGAKLANEQKMKTWESLARNGAAQAFAELGNYPEAITYFTGALALFRETGESEMVVSTLTNLGASNHSLGNYRQALKLYEEAWGLVRQGKDDVSKAKVLTGMGLVHSEMGRLVKAVRCQEMALEIHKRINDPSGKSTTLNNLAVALADLGQVDRALATLEESITIREKLGGQKLIASLYLNLASLHSQMGDFQKAISAIGTGFRLFQGAEDARGQALALTQLGGIYSDLRNYDFALELLMSAIKVQEQTADLKAQTQTAMALGHVYSGLGDQAKAVKYYDQAMTLARTSGDFGFQIQALSNIGSWYADEGNIDKALEFTQLAASLAEEFDDFSSLPTILNNLSVIHSWRGNQGEAIKVMERAIRLSIATKNQMLTSLAFANMAGLLNQDSPDLAISFAKQGITLRQSQRANIRLQDQKLQSNFRDSIAAEYRRLADLLIRRGRIAEAGRVLDLLKETEAAIYDGRDSATADRLLKESDLTPGERTFLESYKASADKLTTLALELDELNQKIDLTPQDEKRIAELQKQVGDAEQSLTLFLQKEINRGKGKPAATPQEDVASDRARQETLRKVQTTTGQRPGILRYVVTDESVSVILVTPETRAFASVNLKTEGGKIKSQEDLNRMVFEFLSELQNPSSDPLPEAKQLYDLLFGKIQKQIRDAKVTLLFVSPDAALRNIPFAALSPDGTTWLGHQVNLVNFSLQALDRFAEPDSPQQRAVIFGMTSEAKVPFGGREFSFKALPFVNKEVEAIGKVLPSEPFLDGQFNQQSFGRAVARRNRTVLHVASHFHRELLPEFSFLLLGDGSALALNQIRNSAGSAFQGLDLLTLSACDTATEQQPSGLDAQGRSAESFADTVLKLGAKSVLASLWKVNDASTAGLMTEFYRLRATNPKMTKSEALRFAMIGVAGGKVTPSSFPRAVNTFEPTEVNRKFAGTSHPYFWSPFVLYGNGI